MSDITINPDNLTQWKGDSSSSSEVFAIVSELNKNLSATISKKYSSFFGDYQSHKEILDKSSSSFEDAVPIYFIRISKTKEADSENSSKYLSGYVVEYYNKIEKQLGKLRDESEEIEKGAAESALTVVNQLRCRHIAPPVLSWHGGDAVVMLWGVGDTTYAITVTDGELGYVVRRDRKSIRRMDSIKIDSFRLEDLR